MEQYNTHIKSDIALTNSKSELKFWKYAYFVYIDEFK